MLNSHDPVWNICIKWVNCCYWHLCDTTTIEGVTPPPPPMSDRTFRSFSDTPDQCYLLHIWNFRDSDSTLLQPTEGAFWFFFPPSVLLPSRCSYWCLHMPPLCSLFHFIGVCAHMCSPLCNRAHGCQCAPWEHFEDVLDLCVYFPRPVFPVRLSVITDVWSWMSGCFAPARACVGRWGCVRRGKVGCVSESVQDCRLCVSGSMLSSVQEKNHAYTLCSCMHACMYITCFCRCVWCRKPSYRHTHNSGE